MFETQEFDFITNKINLNVLNYKMTFDTDFQARANEYKQKLVISTELVKVSKNLYSSFIAISKLEKLKIEQLEHMKTFATKFYNKDCVYREYADTLKNAIEFEINETKRMVG